MVIGVNGIQLYYTKTGQGRPLIMVHGNGEDHTIFDEAVGVLKEHFTCYCIDSRGHGSWRFWRLWNAAGSQILW